ncbi:hypothetical protein Tco_0831995 [Tanacetum coccineum]
MDAKATVQHDYTIIESPRAVVFLVDNNDRKIMRFNEIYKFSDGTLTRILEALDYRVKEFKVKRLNSGMNTRFWTEKDVTSPSSSISVKYSGPSLMVGDFNEGSSKDYMGQARVDVSFNIFQNGQGQDVHRTECVGTTAISHGGNDFVYISRLRWSKMSFHQALDLILELDEAAVGCTWDILRQRD